MRLLLHFIIGWYAGTVLGCILLRNDPFEPMVLGVLAYIVLKITELPK